MPTPLKDLLTEQDIRALPDEAIDELIRLIEHEKTNKIEYLYPDTGPLRRELYPKHLEFFKASATHKEICLLAANRTGKTLAGCAQDTYHLTGEYPEWWPGRRFDGPTKGWVAGTTNETTRDILQATLLGEPGVKSALGTGLIPKKNLIGEPKARPGVPDAVDTVRIRHISGGVSTLQFKTYKQERIAFEGTARHFIHLDEECPMDIYGECLIRTMTTKGLVYITFTPLQGVSETVLQFMPHMNPEADIEPTPEQQAIEQQTQEQTAA